MKIPIIFVIPPSNCATEHSARKLSRNCGEYGAILRPVGYVCARAVSPAAYWIFDTSSNTYLIRLFRWASRVRRGIGSLFHGSNCFSMTAAPSSHLSICVRAFFFCVWFINAHTTRRPAWCFVSISVTYSRNGGFKSDRDRQSVMASKNGALGVTQL